MIPNTTPTPNIIFNGEMKKMSDTEFRITMIVVRATLGWELDKKTGMRKIEDWISHSQLIEKSGRGSRAVSYAIDSCVKKKWIETRDENGNLLKTAEERKLLGKKIFYRLGKIFLETIANNANLPSQSFPRTIANDDTKPSQKVRTTKETITKETIQKIESTPKQKFLSFLKIPTQQKITLIEEELKRNLSAAEKTEIENFISYWTELNQNGTKQRWQLERTFDYLRRVKTWFQNISKFNNKNYGNNKPKSTKYSGQHKQAA